MALGFRTLKLLDAKPFWSTNLEFWRNKKDKGLSQTKSKFFRALRSKYSAQGFAIKVRESRAIAE